MEAYNNGYEAGYNDQPYKNPYPDDTQQSDDWYRGYNDGQAEWFSLFRKENRNA